MSAIHPAIPALTNFTPRLLLSIGGPSDRAMVLLTGIGGRTSIILDWLRSLDRLLLLLLAAGLIEAAWTGVYVGTLIVIKAIFSMMNFNTVNSTELV